MLSEVKEAIGYQIIFFKFRDLLKFFNFIKSLSNSNSYTYSGYSQLSLLDSLEPNVTVMFFAGTLIMELAFSLTLCFSKSEELP
jgi:hypothetical protein